MGKNILEKCGFTCFISCDQAEPWQFYFQDSASPIAEGIVDLHDHISYNMILILVAVS